MTSPLVCPKGAAAAMATGPDREPPGRDESADDGSAPVPSEDFESFLSAVRGMVYGEEPADQPADQPREQPGEQPDDRAAETTPAAPADERVDVQARVPDDAGAGSEQVDSWLPGTWVVDEPAPRGGRRAARRRGDALAAHEKKLLKAERRNARKGRKRRSATSAEPAQDETAAAVEPARGRAADQVARVPTQQQSTGASDDGTADARGEPSRTLSRRERREERRAAARARTVTASGDAGPDAPDELVESVGAPRSRVRGERRAGARERRRRGELTGSAAAGGAEYRENGAVSGPMSETDSMSQLDSDAGPAAKRRTSRSGRPHDGAGTPAEVSAPESPVEPAITEPEKPEPASPEPADPEPARAEDVRIEEPAVRPTRAERRRQRALEKRQLRDERLVARVNARATADEAKVQRRHERRAQRLETQIARAEARTAEELAALERRQEKRAGRLDLRTASDDPAPTDESLEEYLARVEAPLLSRRNRLRLPLRVRNALRVAAVVVLIAGAAVVPWAAPRVPDLIADALSGNDASGRVVEDPPVAPPTDAFAGPVGIEASGGPFDGVRLASAGWPRQVVVPRLHVDSEVIPISGQSGSLLPPDDPQVLGWWREGQPVGAQYGTAVVTGHTVHTGGGALDHLGKLVVGDKVQVRTDDGWITYVVQRTHVYSTEELARDAEHIFRLGGTGRLVLITCDDFNGTFYESNAVVFASPVTDDPFVGEGVGDVPDGGPTGTP